MSRSSINFDAIPKELKALVQWVLWRYGALRPDGKRAKIPLTSNGKPAKVNDPATWSTFQAVSTAFSNPFRQSDAFDGIGFVLSAEDGILGFDLDGCVGEDGTIAPWAWRFLEGLPTYWERSPSGRGLRAFINGSLPAPYGNGTNRTLANGGKIEIYSSGRYLTVTGGHLPGTPLTIEPLQDALEALLARELPPTSTGGFSVNDHPFFGAPLQSYRIGDYAQTPPVDFPSNDEAAIVQLRNKLGRPFSTLFDDGDVSAYAEDESKADFALLCYMVRECGPAPELLDRLYKASALCRRPGRAEKWETKHSADGRTYGHMTITKAIAAVAASSVRSNGASAWKIESARAVVERGVPTLVWDVAELLTADDGPAVFFAPPGHLKSWLVLHLCICMATGAPFLGHFPVRRRNYVVYINLDSGANAFSRRLVTVNPPANLLIVNATQYDPAEFERVFQTYPGAFVVVDCLADVGGVPPRGEDAAQATRKFFRQWRALYERYGSNGVVLDHPHRPKDGAFDYYGSIQKEAAVRTMWMASLIDDREGWRSVKIECRKQSEAERFRAFVATVDFRAPLVHFEFQGYLNEVTHQRQEAPSDVERVASVLHGVPEGLTCKQIMVLTGLARDRVRSAVKYKRFHSTGGGRATRYTLAESNEPPGDSAFDSDSEAAESNGSSETLGQQPI